MTGRARRQRRFQQTGPACLRAGRLAIIAAASVMAVAGGTSASAARHLSASHADAAQADAAAADAVVARLHELPLPLRALPQGVPSARSAPPPLPALESRRQRVYAQLHALGPASVPALARALRDPDPEMRRNVAVALDVVGGGWWHFPDGSAKLDLRPALSALLVTLQDSDPGVRAWAAQDIGDLGAAAATAVPRLRAMLHSADAGSRASACGALGGIGFPARAALPDLRNALDDSSPEVRQAARAAIASIGRASAPH